MSLYPIWKYGRFFIGTLFVLGAIILEILSSPWLGTYGGIGLILFLIGDLYLPKDENIYTYDNPKIFYPIQYASQIIDVFAVIMFGWMLGASSGDFLGLSAALHFLTGYDMLAAHTVGSNAGQASIIAAFAFASGAAAQASIAVGHELTHRIDNRVAVFFGRVGEAFGMHTRFSIRHPYGHHNWVCTEKDPATAKRGEHFYPFVFRSIIGQNIQVWELEKSRLEKMGYSAFSWRNYALRGWGMELAIMIGFYYAAGWIGVFGFLAVGANVNLILEFANYIEHFGLVRIPSEPQQVRHAWNDNHMVSFWLTSAISRHAHHHANADIEFWNLEPMTEEAPTTPAGYLGAFLLASVPTLWHQVMNTKLLEWDEKFATEEEKEQAAIANLNSGQAVLIEAGRKYLKNKASAAA